MQVLLHPWVPHVVRAADGQRVRVVLQTRGLAQARVACGNRQVARAPVLAKDGAMGLVCNLLHEVGARLGEILELVGVRGDAVEVDGAVEEAVRVPGLSRWRPREAIGRATPKVHSPGWRMEVGKERSRTN